MEEPFWGSEVGIREQKEFMAQLPKGWIRLLQTYRTVSGGTFQRYLGDEYEFRKIEDGIETQAIRLYYDWDRHWRIFVAREFETEGTKITKIKEYDHYEFRGFEEAKEKALDLMKESNLG